VNRSIRRSLEREKRKIFKRLEPLIGGTEPRRDGVPELRASGIVYELAHPTRAIPCGGIGGIMRLIDSVGLPVAINERAGVLKIARPYRDSDHVLSIAINLLCGGEVLEDTRSGATTPHSSTRSALERFPIPRRLATTCDDSTSEAYVLDLTTDILDAVDWHAKAGYSGEEFLFSKDGAFPRYIDSHKRPLKLVQQKLGLRLLSHHKLGRHSVASQAVTGGESVKAVQAQLGHRSEPSTHQYAHLGSGAQRRLVEALKPARAPHEPAPKNGHGNLASTASKTHLDDGSTLH
jgi:hypothetical protein